MRIPTCLVPVCQRLFNTVFFCGTVAQTCNLSGTLRVFGFFFFHLKKFCRGHCSCIDSFITFGVLDQMRLVQTLARLQQQAESPAQAFQTSDVVPVKAPYTSTWSVCIVDQFRPIQTRKFDDPEAVWQCLFPVLRPRFDGWCVLLMTLVWVT